MARQTIREVWPPNTSRRSTICGRRIGGKAAALNLGIAASRGDAIIVLDDDDLFPPWTLEKHAAALSRNPAADFSYGRFVRFRGKALPKPSDLWDEELVPTRDPRRLVVKLMEKCFLPNPAWAVRREAQLRVGPYDQSMYRSQDYDMIMRLARTNEGAFVDDRVLYQRTHMSLRGPAADRTYTKHAVDKWIKYDALIFRRSSAIGSPPISGPFSTAILLANIRLRFSRRGVILFQRKVYDGAKSALDQYRRSLDPRSASSAELRIASGLLGCRYGIGDLAGGGSPGKEVAGWLRAMHWPLSMRMSFATQLRWRVWSALTSADARYAGRLLEFRAPAFGIAATLAVMGSKYNAGASAWRGSK